MNYRYKHCLKVISIPSGFEEEDRGLKGCCERELKLASLTDNDAWKNDLIGVAIKLSDESDVVNFRIEKCGENGFLNNLGNEIDFPQDGLARGFVFDCRQYLSIYGIGVYKVSVEFTISGETGSYVWGQYDLRYFSIKNASKTTRIFAEFNSYSQKQNIDFTGSNFQDTIRFEAMFGNREPKTEIKNLITKGRKVEKVTRENLNLYTLSTSPLGVCITRRLLDWILLNEDTLKISDHNRFNHDYLLLDKPVVLEEPPEVEYFNRNRKAKLNIKFSDRTKTDKSFYNQN